MEQHKLLASVTNKNSFASHVSTVTTRPLSTYFTLPPCYIGLIIQNFAIHARSIIHIIVAILGFCQLGLDFALCCRWFLLWFLGWTWLNTALYCRWFLLRFLGWTLLNTALCCRWFLLRFLGWTGVNLFSLGFQEHKVFIRCQQE